MMSLQHPELAILDFDGTYEVQPELCTHFPHRWLDFHQLHQTNLYCSLESFRTIQNELSLAQRTGITLLGSGNYHYVALALLARLERPFTLILVDHHTDCLEAAVPEMLSCGSWLIHAARELPLLKRIIMTGPSEESLLRLDPIIRERVVAIPDLGQAEPQWLLEQIPTDDVYVSIDKDALAPSQAHTNWDQGNLRLDCLLPHLRAWLRSKNVRGVDICGELPASPLELLRPEVGQAIALNEHTNELLLETVLAAA